MEGQTFDELGLKPWLVGALRSLHIEQPTAIQAACIGPALAGRDVIGCGETGAGKTLAFGLPIVQGLSEDLFGIAALILTPSRELAVQISEQLTAVGAPLRLQVVTVIGGLDQVAQSKALNARPHVVVATPGRLAELLTLGSLSISKLKWLVLDEADRLLSMGFEEQLKVIIAACPAKRQTMLFSATMSPTLQVLEAMSLRNPFRYDQAENGTLLTVKTLRQELVVIPAASRDAWLVYLARSYAAANVSIIFFCPTVEDCALLHHMLQTLLDGATAVALHSLMSQALRLRALSDFRNGRARVLVATDVASRGLDIPMTDLVVNASVPTDPATYVHRVGRTARAGRPGRSITLVSQFEVGLLLAIEDAIGLKLAEHPHDEDEVLKFLGEANAARRVAELWWQEQGLAERDERRKQESREKRRKSDKPK